MKQFNRKNFLTSGKPHTFKMTLDDGFASYQYDLNLTENWCMNDIQKEIQELNKKRETYIASQQKDSEKGELENAMLTAIKKQAAKKNYSWE